MKRSAALFVALLIPLLSARAPTATAYVSDELVLGVFAEQNGQGQRLTTLHSGASVETLAVSGEFTQVRLNDGTTGWVKSTYLTTREPATSRLKQLEEELDRSRCRYSPLPADPALDERFEDSLLTSRLLLLLLSVSMISVDDAGSAKNVLLVGFLFGDDSHTMVLFLRFESGLFVYSSSSSSSISADADVLPELLLFNLTAPPIDDLDALIAIVDSPQYLFRLRIIDIQHTMHHNIRSLQSSRLQCQRH